MTVKIIRELKPLQGSIRSIICIMHLKILTTTVKLIFVLFFSLLFCSELQALDPDKSIDRYLLDQWEIPEGLPSRNILSIAQTPDGYLWFATTKGLVRFDGVTFSAVQFFFNENQDSKESKEKKIIPPDTLLVDKQGNLWIGSTAGLTKYRYKTGQFTTFSKKHGLSGDRIRRIREDVKGNLWIGLWVSYLNRFTNGKFTLFDASRGLEGKKINAVLEDMKGNLLVGTREKGVFELREGKFVKFDIDGLGSNRLIITMYEDRKGELWIGTNKGLFRVKTLNRDKVTDVYTTGNGLSNDYIIDILEDCDRNLWIGTLSGLNRLRHDPDGSIAFEKILGNHIITCLFEDKEKSLWIGTDDSGLKRLREGKFISLATIGKQEEIILSLFEDRQGNTWVGTLRGKLYRYTHGQFMESPGIPGISGTGIAAIAEDGNGNLWLGTNGKGVYKNEAGTFINFTTRDGLADNLVMSIFCDSKNNLWFSTSDGVSVLRDGSTTFKSFKTRDGLLGKVVHNVYEDKNHHIQIATNRGINVLKNGEFTENSRTEYLKDFSVTCIYRDKENVSWISTHGAGLKRFKNGEFISYTAADGMSTNFLYQVFEDQWENLWILSDSGVLRVSKKELRDYTLGNSDRINCTSFGVSEGIESIDFYNKFSRNSLLKRRKGGFWFATKKGITVVNPGKIRINKFPPPVIIERVVFQRPSGQFSAAPYHPLLQHQKAFKGVTGCTFYFTAPSFLSPGKIKFKYKLDEYDRGWIYLRGGEERKAGYRDLSPGTYTFRVTACNSDGIWNRTGNAMTFTIIPFFNETLLFKILILLVSLSLGAGLYFLYKKRMPGKNKKYKYKRSSLNPIYMEECIKKLTYLMEVKKVFCDETLSLQSLSEKLSTTPHQLSQIINEKLKKNFSDFVNAYRIEEAKKRLTDPKGDRKIITIAFDVGFNTKVAFNKTFKKYTNLTPSQYRKKELKNLETKKR